MYLLFNPSIVFACSEIWENPKQRDMFLTEFSNWLEVLNQSNELQILWSDELEANLWSYPARHPWFATDFNIPLVSVLQQIFRSRVVFTAQHDEASNCSPDLDCQCEENQSPLVNTMCVAHAAVHSELDFLFCDDKYTGQNLELSCSCPATSQVSVACASSSSQVLASYNVPLPRTIEEFEESIGLLIEQTRQRIFGLRPLCYNPVFDSAFVNDFISCARNHKLILKAVTKRLVFSPEEAVKDNGLRDKEYQGDKAGLRRIRVTLSSRIDYLHISGRMEFKRYFDEGKYDDSI